MNLEELGITRDEILDRLIGRLQDDLIERYEIQDEIKKRINEVVQEIGEKHIVPIVREKVEGLVLQKTNAWGEGKGNPAMTFIEYLTDRAEKYLSEKVDFEGKSKDQSRGYSWNGAQSRVTHIVHQHLHYSIESAMKAAVKSVNTVLAEGLEETCRIKLAEITDSIRVQIKTKT